MLYDLTVEYVGASFSEKTKRGSYTTFYKGGEYIVAGKIKTHVNLKEEMQPEIIISALQYLPQKYERRILPCDIKYEKNISLADSEIVRGVSIFSNRASLCIPVDTQRIARSDPENFIERLWAYLTIQNLLDETYVALDPSAELSTAATQEKYTESNDNANLEMVKSDRDRALEIALKYNFVTDVTSLLIRKPLKSNKEFSTSYVNQQQINYAYSQKVGVSPYIYALSPASIPIASTNLPATPNSGSNLVLAKVHSTLSSSQRYNPVGGGGAAHTYGLTPVLVGLSASFSGSIPAKIAEVRCS